MNPFYNGFSVIAIVIAKRWFNGENLLDNDWFPASGTDFSLYDNLKTADRWVSKWPPVVQNGPPLFSGLIFRFTGTGKWPPYGRSSLDDEVFHPLECINRFLMHFNGFFPRLTGK